MIARGVAVVGVVLAAATASVAGEAEPARPNVILAMADDLGFADLGHLGNPWVRTPNLDRMARAGLRFDRFYSASPVCAPTRFSVLTGRHGYRSGIWRSNVGRVRDEEVTIAEILRDHGWRTGHFGKWHIGGAEPAGRDAAPGPAVRLHLPRHGFDVQFSTTRRVPTWDPLLHPIDERHDLSWFPLEDPTTRKEVESPFMNERGALVTDNVGGDVSRIVLDRALPFIEDAVGSAQPFLAVIWFHAVHYPVVGGRPWADLYAGRTDFDRCYYATVTALDAQLGRLRDALDALGCADDTMLWFCSDNGAMRPGSTAPFRDRKQTLWEGGVRVPSVLVWPGRVAPGRSTTRPVVTSDYLPTILDLLGLPPAPVSPLDGISQRALVEGDATNERSSPIAFESHGMLGLVDDRWKLVFPGIDDPRLRLFDLVADQYETRDVAAEHPGIVFAMARRLDAWRQSVSASQRGADFPGATSGGPWRGVPLEVSLAELASGP